MEFVYQHLTLIAWIVVLLLVVVSYKWVLWLAGGGSSGGTLVDVLLANVIRDGLAKLRHE